jgi:UDP-2-acetamido-2-deoxy-ribo-hexuluronate aminotransferase
MLFSHCNCNCNSKLKSDPNAQFTVFVENREVIQKSLRDKGVPTAIHYPLPINFQPAYEDSKSMKHTVNSIWASNHVMSLPMSPDLTFENIAYIVDQLLTSLSASQ